MKDIFIGIDGGGTKTKVQIEDSDGNIIGKTVAGAANIRLSVTEAWDSINSGITEALKDTDISLNDNSIDFHIGLGLAGISIQKAKDEFLNTPHPFKTLILESDAHISCLGAHEGKDGSIISIGTGMIGYQIENNITSRVAGWGFPHADTGGGAWLGMEGIRKTLSSLDGCCDMSPMTNAIYEYFNNDLSELVTWANNSNSSNFAKIAPLVTDHAELNDPIAIELVEQAGEEIVSLANALVKKCQNPQKPVSCKLVGGLAPFIYPYIKEKEQFLVLKDRDVAVRGAVFMIKKGEIYA